MGVMIKGIEMPKSCVDCPCELNPFFCKACCKFITDKTGVRISKGEIKIGRPDWCPLVEVKDTKEDNNDSD